MSILTPERARADTDDHRESRSRVPRIRQLGVQRRRNLASGLLFLLPLAAGILVFKAYGFGMNVYLSFTKAGSFGPAQWIGLQNYRNLLVDEQFGQAVLNTLKFVVLGVPPIVVLSVVTAMLLNSRARGIGVFRTIFFLPAVTLPVTLYMGFAWLFNTDYGIVNAALIGLGGEKMNWFGSDFGVTTVFVIVMTYSSFSVPMLVMLAGLNDIPQMYYEAASLDGASLWQQFWHVKLPLLTPSIFYVTTTNIISMFQMFSLAYVMLPEGSAGAQFGQTIVYYYYSNAFVYSGSRGYAAAISLALFAMILAVTAITFGLQKRWVHYEK